MRYLVCVHGVCQAPEGFSDKWWDALSPYTSVFGAGVLGKTRLEAYWSPIVNGPSMDAAKLYAMENNSRLVLSFLSDLSLKSLPSAPLSSWNGCISDFIIYMSNNTVRQEIINVFTDVVQPLLQSGNTVDVIGHSWGTVVSYEGILQISRSLPNPTGRIGTYFTVGAALSIPTVADYLLPQNKNVDIPSFVNQWINIDAEGDVIGGPLRGAYDITTDLIGFPAYGCSGFQPLCAHESYFQAGNVYVNRDIFASYFNSEIPL